MTPRELADVGSAKTALDRLEHVNTHLEAVQAWHGLCYTPTHPKNLYLGPVLELHQGPGEGVNQTWG